MRVSDITGQTFGRLLVIERDHSVQKRQVYWKCRCSCGSETTVFSGSLRYGTTRSCGCFRKERSSEVLSARLTVHGHNSKGKPSPTHNSWNSMRARCEKPSHRDYKYYGGRGITVCERWYRFENFLADMGERPAGKTIDRIDTNGNYEPDNCKWSTASEQNKNRRKFGAAS